MLGSKLALAHQLAGAVQAAHRPFCPHTPHPRQAEFLALDVPEAFYGGAGGGGKSDALLMAALQYVHVPNYNALLLRRTFRALNEPEAIMARADDWLRGNPRCKWEDEEKQWRFLESNATLGFGYFDTARDKDNYQGGAYQFIGWDELTQFPSAYYTYMFSRLRRPKEGPLSAVPLRMRGAANPGGIGHEWVYARFVDPETATAPFIPAKLDDNPSLDKVEYEKLLALADEITRRQIRDGEWVRDASGLVYHFDRVRNVVPFPDDITSAWHHVLALDFGVTNATSFNVLAWRNNDPRVYLRRSFKATGMITDDVAAVISGGPLFTPAMRQRFKIPIEAPLQELHDIEKIVGDIGGLGKLFVEELRRRFSIPVEAAEKTNKRGFIQLMNGALEHANLVVVDVAACRDFIAEATTLPWADETQQEEMAGFPNHCTDGVLYGWRACPNFAERALPPPPTAAQLIEQQVQRMFPRADPLYEPKQYWEEGTKWK